MGLGKNAVLNDKPDRLSDLHDSLIIRILSCLEMKDVVKTGILSKRWKDTWTQVFNIVYRDKYSLQYDKCMSRELRTELRAKQSERYNSFVSNTLMRCVSNIRKFSLHVIDSGVEDALLHEWIKYVIEKKVEIIKLYLNGRSRPFRDAPDFLFQCSSLTRLKLTYPSFNFPAVVNWPLLKRLSLKAINVKFWNLEDTLLGCPGLETLVLNRVAGVNCLRIKSLSLKKLKLVDVFRGAGNADCILEVTAPLLHEIEISKYFAVTKCVMVDVSSLVKAILRYKHPFDDLRMWTRIAAELLKNLCHVEVLLIGSAVLQVLSISSLSGEPCLTFKCKHLKIDSPLWKYDIFGIVYLLKGMPHLETLVINVSRLPESIMIKNALSPPAHIHQVLSAAKSQFTIPNRNLLHLKNVEINYKRNPLTDYAHQTHGGSFDLELVDYILRSCDVLERLTLCSSTVCCYKKSDCAIRYISQISFKLSMDLLPAIRDARWDLKKRESGLQYSFTNYASMRSED